MSPRFSTRGLSPARLLPQPVLAAEVALASPLVADNPQIDVNFGPVIELADGLGIAFVVIALRIDLIVGRSREAGETVGAVWTGDVGFHGVTSGVGQVDDGTRHGGHHADPELFRTADGPAFCPFCRA